MKNLEQRRAANALARMEEVGRLDDQGSDLHKRYRAYVERLGPAIIMNGLGQALATERAAAGDGNGESRGADARAHAALYRSLDEWLCRCPDAVYPEGTDILHAIVEGDEPAYLRAQAEALAWLEWHKKFCRASFPRGEREE